MNVASHGGHCCGVKHIWGFGFSPTTVTNSEWGRRLQMRNQLKRHIRKYGNIVGNKGKMFEVILTDGQIQSMPDWIAELKALDFRLVTRFNNSTGGWCNVFHKTTGVCRDDNVPDWWKEESK